MPLHDTILACDRFIELYPDCFCLIVEGDIPPHTRIFNQCIDLAIHNKIMYSTFGKVVNQYLDLLNTTYLHKKLKFLHRRLVKVYTFTNIESAKRDKKLIVYVCEIEEHTLKDIMSELEHILKLDKATIFIRDFTGALQATETFEYLGKLK